MTMRLKICPAVILAAMLSVWSSCAYLEPRDEVQGAVTLTIVTDEAPTRAPSGDPGDGGGIAVDGSGNPDLVIAIASSTGTLMAWYPDDFFTGLVMSGDYDTECSTTHTPSTNATASTIMVTGLDRGSYTVLAFANLAGLPSDVRTNLRACTTMAMIDTVRFRLADGQPDFGSKMPLSAKASLSVNASGNGQVDVSLLRPVARISMTFRNQTGGAIEIDTCHVSIGNINPSRGYLMPRATDSVATGLRDMVMIKDRPLVFGTDPQVTATYNRAVLDTVQVFPSLAPARTLGSRYLCRVYFRVTKEGETYDRSDPDTYDEYTFTDLPVHDSHSADITYLRRNQFLKIETRITRRAAEHDYSFNFEVQDWIEKDNYMTFD